ncbi:DUF2505 domain-containing protein [Rhodococcus sp. DMU1]|nr:DUF2505 domain-containing protein [Rhodococcus aetherivorans]PND52563.1 DUF2505 domain-containing protein [Rhodococcus sp. ENV425]QIX49613.1 DUF2505 domain-containing protein [Rhodococcus sp. DMU1]QPG45130.1 DUF2505 domain-containing protein [Rhodococcus sp. M8]USC16892.1 DUF2505 domain-containing protein [Rhodococcus sp. 11-3]
MQLMPKSFAFTTELDHHVRDVHAALIDERYWLDRVADRASATAVVEEPHGPGTLRVTVTDRSEPSELPSIVRGMLRGPLVIERTDEWGPLMGEAAEGRMSGGATGLPVALEGRSRLRVSETGGTFIDVQGQVVVRVPLLGGRIESMVHGMVLQIVENDRIAIAAWLSR